MQRSVADGSDSTRDHGTNKEKLDPSGVGEVGKKKRKSVESPTTTESAQIYSCRFCDLKFAKSQALGGHMNRHRHEREHEQLMQARELVLQQNGPTYRHDTLWNMDLSQNPLSVPALHNTHPRDYYPPSFNSGGHNVLPMMQSTPPPLSLNLQFPIAQSAPSSQYNWLPVSPIPTHPRAHLNATDTTRTLQSGAVHEGIVPSVLQAQRLGTHDNSTLAAISFPARGSSTRQGMPDTGNVAAYAQYEMSSSPFFSNTTVHNPHHQQLFNQQVRLNPDQMLQDVKHVADPIYVMSGGGASTSQFNQPQLATDTFQAEQMYSAADYSQITNTTLATNYAPSDYWGQASSLQLPLLGPASRYEEAAVGQPQTILLDMTQGFQSDPAGPDAPEGPK